MNKRKRAPWQRPNPRKRAETHHLSAARKAVAKRRAKKAGRRYPNLVDNMRASATKSRKNGTKNGTRHRARKRTAGRSRKQAAARRKTAAKRRLREKDPKGGLTAAGRRAFARKQGAHLRPGVKKKAGEMTASEMRRKGSWAVRFYGRNKLPPLVDAQGRPTRHALSAHAWGEPVPRSAAAARRIAAKGRRLLVRYKRAKRA